MNLELRAGIIMSHCIARLSEIGSIDIEDMVKGHKDMTLGVLIDHMKGRSPKLVYTHNLMVLEAIVFIVKMEKLEVDMGQVVANAAIRKKPHKVLRKFLALCMKDDGSWKYHHPHAKRYLTLLDSLADPQVKL